jgi:hypothetical protein
MDITSAQHHSLISFCCFFDTQMIGLVRGYFRLKRLSAKVQKIDAEVSLQVRKASTVSTARGRSAHDTEVDKLEERIREKERLNEAIRKQLMLIKYNPVPVYTSATRRPLSVEYNQNRQPRAARANAPAVNKSPVSAVSASKKVDDVETQRIVSALTLELERCKARLKQAEAEEKERVATKASGADGKDFSRWDNEPVEALRHAVRDLEVKTNLALAREDERIKEKRTWEAYKERRSAEIDELKQQLTSMRSKTTDTKRQIQVCILSNMAWRGMAEYIHVFRQGVTITSNIHVRKTDTQSTNTQAVYACEEVASEGE